jgi:hypothetical protein
VGRLAENRSEDRWFDAGSVADLFEALRVPAPGILEAIGKLEAARLVLKQRGRDRWALTPLGRTRIAQLVGLIDAASVEAEISVAGSAELSQVRHPLIPPELAPERFAPAIRALLERFPFEHNVFLMTRFPKDEKETGLPDPVQRVIGATREALRHHGLTLHLASDRNLDDELFGNIAGHIWACKYGVGLFETRFGEEYNDNLQIEIGAMLMTGRRCALLRDRDTPDMSTDFIGHIYKPVDFDDLSAVSSTVHLWVAEDLGLGRCPHCPLAPGSDSGLK